MRTLAMDPLTPSTLYLSAENPSVSPVPLYKSTNGGQTWTLSSIAQGYITALAVDPVVSARLYASSYGGQFFKSVDGGSSWNILRPSLGAGVLVIDPLNPSTIYAGTGNDVAKSLDGGETWHSTGLGRSSVRALILDPSNSGTIY